MPGWNEFSADIGWMKVGRSVGLSVMLTSTECVEYISISLWQHNHRFNHEKSSVECWLQAYCIWNSIKFYNYSHTKRGSACVCSSYCCCYDVRIPFIYVVYVGCANLLEQNINSFNPFHNNQQFRQTSLDLWCEIFSRLISSNIQTEIFRHES